MGVFDGLLSPAITQAANARTAFKTGQQQAQDDKVRQAMQLLTLKRQAEQDDVANALKRSQTDHLNRLVGEVGVSRVVDADGNVVLVPNKVPLAQLSAPPAASPSQPSPQPAAAPPALPSDSQDMGGGDAPPSSAAVAQDTTSTTKRPSNIPTISTGIKTPVKPTPVQRIDPLSQQGLTADSTRAANRRQVQLDKPLPVRASASTRIDPLSQQGITADSTKKANAAKIAIANPKPAGAGNAQNTLTNARATASIEEMNNSHPQMLTYEQKLKSGTANISGLSQYLSAVGNDFVENKHPAKTAAAMVVLSKSNPELARYIRAGLSFAEGESGISARPSDFRTKMAAFLSTAATGASPDMIDDIGRRRTAIMRALNKAYPGHGGPSDTPSTGSTAKTPAQLWDEAVVLHGKEKVLKEVGPRPPE